MSAIKRYDGNGVWANSGMVEAGGFIYAGYCAGNIGKPIEDQTNGALDHLSERLGSLGLTLEPVVKIDALFRGIWNIPVMEKVFQERFDGKYSARKSIQTEFARIGGQDGLFFSSMRWLIGIERRALLEKTKQERRGRRCGGQGLAIWYSCSRRRRS